MKIDLHTHCLPVSCCAHHNGNELPRIFKNAGMDAIVLTNHCFPLHCQKLSNDLKGQAQKYVDTYFDCKATGEKIGFKVFFGVEIKLINEPYSPEFLLYGMDEEDFIDSYPLYEQSQEQLFNYCNKKNILMVQAHPFREEHGCRPADMRYMHGIEVYNAHPSCEPRFLETLEIAIQNNKVKTAGTDFHVESQAGSAGMIIPDYIDDQFDLRDYLKNEKQTIFNDKGVLEI